MGETSTESDSGETGLGVEAGRLLPACLKLDSPGVDLQYSLYLGLLRELSPGPLAPEARIMPLDQAANPLKYMISYEQKSNPRTGLEEAGPKPD